MSAPSPSPTATPTGDPATVGPFLDALASAAPAPGGGAAAAVQVAIAAALVGMVARLTPPANEGDRTLVASVAHQVDRLRAQALQLATDDGDAFSAVIAAYRLPRASHEQQQARRVSVQRALLGAAEVPLTTMETAAGVIAAVRRLAPVANPRVASDLSGAAIAARAGAEAASHNVDANRVLLDDVDAANTLAARCERLRAEVAEGAQRWA